MEIVTGDILFKMNSSDEYVVLGMRKYPFISDCRFLIKSYKGYYSFDYILERVMEAGIIALYKLEDDFMLKPCIRENLIAISNSVCINNYYKKESCIDKQELKTWILKNKVAENCDLTIIDEEEAMSLVKYYYDKINT